MKVADIEVTYLGGFGSDLTVVDAARVSMHKESNWEYKNPETFEEGISLEEQGWEDVTDLDKDLCSVYRKLQNKDVNLIKYLSEHKHFSPFNHAFLSFRVKAPIFVARQLVKHKFMPFNEVSRRYVDEEPEFYFPKYWRAKADNVKQGSSEAALEMVYPNFDLGMWIESQTNEQTCLYKQCLAVGMCAEQARMVLPQNTMTEWIWSGTLGAFLDMLVLRLDPHTQQETREVAKKIALYVEEQFPVSYKYRVGV